MTVWSYFRWLSNFIILFGTDNRLIKLKENEPFGTITA